MQSFNGTILFYTMVFQLELFLIKAAIYKVMLIADLCQPAEVQKIGTSPYHPQTNGQHEHCNSTLLNILDALSPDHKKDWEVHVPVPVHAFNSTKNAATGYNFYFLLYGREPTLSLILNLVCRKIIRITK